MGYQRQKVFFPFLIINLSLLFGCSNNPVTGHKELHFVSQTQEVAIGEQNYQYGQQQSGGQYILDKKLTQYINHVGQKLTAVSARSDLPYKFTIINSSIPNAWAMPGGKITINRGLLIELKSEAELAAVLSHEITHAAARHAAKSMERNLILMASLSSTSILLDNDDEHRLRNSAILTSASVAAGLLNTRYGRSAELEADYYGMQIMAKAGYAPQAAINLQKTFVRLSEGKKTNWLTGLFASHPPSQERVYANEQTAKKLQTNLPEKKKPYQQHIAKLLKDKPAYTAYDQGEEALAKGDLITADKFADLALSLVPNESLFLNLKGDIQTTKKQYKIALSSYNKAIAINPNYFYPFLQKGLILYELKRNQEAKQALKNSINLLPTKIALSTLEALN